MSCVYDSLDLWVICNALGIRRWPGVEASSVVVLEDWYAQPVCRPFFGEKVELSVLFSLLPSGAVSVGGAPN